MLPAFDFIAKKYNLPIVDLYHPFLNHRELYKVPPDGEGEGEHANPAGLTLIAQTVFAAMKADLRVDGGMATDGSMVIVDASAGSGGASGAGGAAAGAGGSGGSAVVGAAGSQGTGGDQAGSSVTGQTGGSSNAAGSAAAAPPADAGGCSCSLANQSSSSRSAVFALGGLALLLRKRQRTTIKG